MGDFDGTVRWLERARELERRIQLRNEQAERIRQALLPGASKVTGMPRGGGGDWTDRVATVVELEKEIAGEIDEMRRARGEIVRAIEAVDDADQRTVLEMRYLAGRRFDAIAREMHYDRTWIWEIHKRGVGAVAQIVNTTQRQNVI